MLETAFIHKYRHLEITHTLHQCLQQLNQQASETIFQHLATLYDLINQSIAAKDTPFEIMTAVYKFMDKEALSDKGPKPPHIIQCKKGCAACCHYQVAISDLEALAIWEYCSQKGVNIDLEYLHRQLPLAEETHPYSPDSACVFLGADNTCTIYDMRPLSCRKYQVVTPAIYCDIKSSGSSHLVARFPNLFQEIMACALWNCSRNDHTMAVALLLCRPL